MLLVAAAVVGLLGGLLTGGSMRGLLARRLRWPLVVITAFVARELLIRTPLSDSPLAPDIFVVSLAVLVAWTAWHRDELPGIWLVTAGIAMNLLVVVLNGGRMPVDPALAGHGPAQLSRAGFWASYVLRGPDTRLGWLGDWILIPRPAGLLFPQVYSPGDLVAAAGLAATLFLATRPRPSVTGRAAITSR